MKKNDLLRRDARVMANARKMIKATRSTPNWVLYSRLFGTGSTTAWDCCKRLGLDPDSIRTPFNSMIEYIENLEVVQE